jgi:hypothetical protein
MMRFAVFLALAVATCAETHAQQAAGQCSARSGAKTVALVELYTSEGCDSCPPADEWLASLGARGYAPDRVVPIALHVDYWDYIGWKDPYAKREFATRQRKHAAMKRAKVVYTPQVVLQGEDFRAWRSTAFDDAVARINARPPRASISLGLGAGNATAFDVEATAELAGSPERLDAALYLAAYENKLVSSVTAGENRGRTLAHDYVVLEWAKPLEFGAGKRVSERRTLPLLPRAVRKNSGVVAFVQDRKSGEVLQALMLPTCQI